MKVGVFFSTANPEPWLRDWHVVYKETLEQAQWAEELGFDAVATTEHHFAPDGYMTSPLVFEAALAAVTKRVEIASFVLLLPMYHPIRLAEEAAMVDILSGGRLTLGMGIGYRWEEYDAFGLDRSKSGKIADEALEVIVRAFTENTFSFRGEHYEFRDITLMPKPYRKPRPPIWIGLPTTSAGVKRVAKWGLEGFAGIPSPRMYSLYLDYCREFGTEPRSTSQILLFGHCAADPDLAWKEAGRHGQWVWSLYRKWWWTYGDTRHMGGGVRDRMIFGDPKTWLEALKPLQKLDPPMSHVFVSLQLPGLPHEKVMASMELFAKSVLPIIQTATV